MSMMSGASMSMCVDRKIFNARSGNKSHHAQYGAQSQCISAYATASASASESDVWHSTDLCGCQRSAPIPCPQKPPPKKAFRPKAHMRVLSWAPVDVADWQTAPVEQMNHLPCGPSVVQMAVQPVRLALLKLIRISFDLCSLLKL